MIYTIGPREIWLDAIREHKVIYRIGRNTLDTFDDCPEYLFGYAFQTAEDAKRGLIEVEHKDKWAVFGLEADWEKDTAPAENSWWHELLNDSKIVVLAVSI